MYETIIKFLSITVTLYLCKECPKSVVLPAKGALKM